MCRIWQHRAQDWTRLLDWQVIMAEEHLANSRAWHMYDTACEEMRDWHEEVRDWANQELWARLLALEQRHVDAVKCQAVLMASTVEAMEEDHEVLDTFLVLAVTFVPPAALPPALAPSACWQLFTIQQQVPLWAWVEVQWHFHQPGGSALPRAPATQPPHHLAPPLILAPCSLGAGAACSRGRIMCGPCWPGLLAAEGGVDHTGRAVPAVAPR
ncbi:hypothetical protein Y1Q_0020045 [Alligator mississippiensis]|uniref:Uncharacterized protein n=1 Tax=Alligator mississippiensis TaxID=8496 RepID=A0A151LYS5_ALLMI|nr:hypothetical protein Y1Q_0020045 [Alligator mississippiensis]